MKTQAQLDKIQNSVLMIDMHRSTIEGTAMDISVLEALKASGETLRQMGVTKEGLSAVYDLVSSIEESMQSAAEITSVLSSGSVSGVVNSMAAYGVAVDEDELMRELDDMMMEDVQPESAQTAAEGASSGPGVAASAGDSTTAAENAGVDVPAAADAPGQAEKTERSADGGAAAEQLHMAAAPKHASRLERKESKKERANKEESREMLAF